MSVSELTQAYNEFQSDAVNAIVKDFTDDPRGRYLLVIPTGGGKTWTAVKAINALFQNKILNSRSDRVLWVCHRIELEDQAKDTFLEYSEDDQNSKSYDEQVTYERDTTKIGKRLKDQSIKIVVIDEAHHSKANTYQPIFKKETIGVLGLTATPSRHDGKALEFTKESYSIGVPDLIQRQVIIDPKIEPPIKTDHKDTDERFDSVLDKLNNEERNNKIISVLKERHEKYHKVVIYVGTETHVKDLYQQITQSSLNKCYPSINWILGGRGKSKNSRRLDRKDFIEHEKKQEKSILINIEVLSEGYDDPTIDTIIMACPMKSTLKYMQAAGRAIRRDKNNEDKKAYIVPVEDNLPNIRYRFDNRWLYSDISDALEPKVIDKTYSDKTTFKNRLETIYSDPKSFVKKNDRIYPPYDKDDRFSIVLFKVFGGDNSRHLPVILNNQNRIQFKSRFDFLSERLAHQKPDYARNHIWALPTTLCESLNALKTDEDRRHAWDAMKSSGKSISDSPREEKSSKKQMPWIQFVSLRYKATGVRPDLLEFMNGMVNKDEISEDIIFKRFEPPSVLLKLPLPLGQFKGKIVSPKTFIKVEKLVSDLKIFQTTNKDSDYLDDLNQLINDSSFPIESKYQPCLTTIVGNNFTYSKKL